MGLVNEPKTKRGMDTLEKICQAAESLFCRKGYYATGISDIAAEAGIAQGTIYIYFPDKSSIFHYLLDDLSQQLRRKLRDAISHCTTRYEIEYNGIKAFLDFVKNHEGLFKLVWQAQFVDMELFKEYYNRFSRGYMKAIRKAQLAGEMKEMDPEVLSYCLIGISNFIALKYVVFDDLEDTEQAVREVMRLLEHGALHTPIPIEKEEA